MNSVTRNWKASWRDTTLLLREFRQPVLVFSLAIFVCALVYYLLAQELHEPIETFAEALYLMLTLTFLQPSQEFPNHAILQIFFFLMPVIGVLTLAQGLADFGYLLFNRRARSKEWEMAVASTLSNHHVLVGLGHLGYRVADQLHDLGEEVATIELNPSADMAGTVQKMGIPVIHDDATRELVLEGANIKKAKSIILCTQNDALNLKIALKARSLNPNIQVVIRIFDEDFAQSLHDQFGFTALSGTGIAAPVFAASAAGADITNPISIEGEALSLGRLTIASDSPLIGKTVGYVEDNYSVSIILVRYDHHSDLHPTDSKKLNPGDQLAVLGRPHKLHSLLHDCQ
jgi:Trk K+ transport system NAD-binding subunit